MARFTSKSRFLSRVAVDGMLLSDASDEIQDDRSIVLIAIANAPRSFKYASDRLRNDRVIANLAISLDKENYYYLGSELSNDIDIANEALAISFDYLRGFGVEINSNKEIALRIFNSDVYVGDCGFESLFCCLADKLRTDEDIVDLAIKKGVNVFYNCYTNYKNKEAVLKSLNAGINANYKYQLDEELFADKEVVMAALKLNLIDLYNIDLELRCDKEIALLGVRNTGKDITQLPFRMKNDIDVITEAIKQNGNTFDCIDRKHYKNNELVMLASQTSGTFFNGNEINEEMLDNIDFAKNVFNHSTRRFHMFSENIRANKEIVLEVVSKDANKLKYVAGELNDDEEVVMAAIERDGSALEYVSDRLKNDPEIIKKCFKSNRNSYHRNWCYYVGEELKYIFNDHNNNHEEMIDTEILKRQLEKELKNQPVIEKKKVMKI